MSKTTIYDIASHLGVSTATVSRVLKKDERISRQTAAKVLEAIKELDFVPRSYRQKNNKQSSQNSRSRVNSNKGTIYFLDERPLVFSIPTQIYSSLLKFYSKHGYQTIVSDMNEFLASPPDDAAGIVYYGDSSRLSQVLALNIPCVRVMMQPQPAEFSCDHVSYNNDSIGVMAARYLIERGHRNVVMIGQKEKDFVRLRYNAFKHEMDKHNVSCRLIDTYHINSQTIDIPEEVLRDPARRPTGYFLFNDELALMLYSFMSALGLNPGKDFDAVSCDNSDQIRELEIKPATFELHLPQIASRAGEQLLWRMKHRDAQPNVLIIEPEMKVFNK